MIYNLAVTSTCLALKLWFFTLDLAWFDSVGTNLGLLYKKSLDYELVGFCDADYAGYRIERKSTSGNCQFLGENLISWASKRQAIIALSTAEAKYISAASCCTQLL